MAVNRNLLDDRILKALEPAVGRRLVQVLYCCLKDEATEKDIADPEFYLGGEIGLIFEPDYRVWVAWDENAGWEQHFSVSALTDRTFGEGAVQCFEASSLELWVPFIGSELEGFEILGWEDAPDVIRLVFAHAAVLVGSGYQGRFGDGDDVFARADTGRYLDGKEKKLGSSEGVA